MPLAEIDSCAVLGVQAGSPQWAVRKAYLAAALSTHPDKPGGNAEAFQKVAQAYANLSSVKAASSNTVSVEASRRTWTCGGYIYAVAAEPGCSVIAVGDNQSIILIDYEQCFGRESTTRRFAARSVRDGPVGLLACCLFLDGQNAAVGASDGSVHCITILGKNKDSEIWQHPERRPIIAMVAKSSFIVCAAADCAHFYVLSLSLDSDLPIEVFAVRRISSSQGGQIDAIALSDNFLVTSGSQQDADSGFVSCWKLDASEPLDSNHTNESDAQDIHLWTVLEDEPVFSVAARRSLLAWVSGPTCKTFDILTEQSPAESPIWTQYSEGRELRAVSISPLGGLVAACGVDEAVYVWHHPSGTVAAVFHLNNVIHCCLATSCINCITFTCDGCCVVTGGYDSKVTIWQLPDSLCALQSEKSQNLIGRTE